MMNNNGILPSDPFGAINQAFQIANGNRDFANGGAVLPFVDLSTVLGPYDQLVLQQILNFDPQAFPGTFPPGVGGATVPPGPQSGNPFNLDPFTGLPISQVPPVQFDPTTGQPVPPVTQPPTGQPQQVPPQQGQPGQVDPGNGQQVPPTSTSGPAQPPQENGQPADPAAGQPQQPANGQPGGTNPQSAAENTLLLISGGKPITQDALVGQLVNLDKQAANEREQLATLDSFGSTTDFFNLQYLQGLHQQSLANIENQSLLCTQLMDHFDEVAGADGDKSSISQQDLETLAARDGNPNDISQADLNFGKK